MCDMGPATGPAPILSTRAPRRGRAVCVRVRCQWTKRQLPWSTRRTRTKGPQWRRCGPGDTGTGVCVFERRLRHRATGTRAQGPRATHHDGQLELEVRVTGRATARGRARPGQGACHGQTRTHHFKVPASAPGLRPPGRELGRGPAPRCERALAPSSFRIARRFSGRAEWAAGRVPSGGRSSALVTDSRAGGRLDTGELIRPHRSRSRSRARTVRMRS